MERNTSLSNDLHALRNATTAIESIKYTKNDEQNVNIYDYSMIGIKTKDFS